MSSGRHWGSSTAVEGLWRNVDGPGDWSQLVLPAKLTKELKAVPALYIERVRLSHGAEPGPGEWLIFEGPSGTGRSSAAHALANELRLPLLEADAATWTASLDDLFGPVAGRFAVLAIDHADALLSDATVGPQLRRWRRELPSLVIFCVGSRRGFPVAILESFDRILAFPDPDPTARREIWRRALPSDAAVSAKTINALAHAFALSGKEIVSCAVAAESWSLEHRVPLSEAMLADVTRDMFPGRARPSTPTRTRARAVRLGATAVALAGAIAAVAGGLALSRHSSPPAAPPALDRQGSVGSIHFSYPSQWRAAGASEPALSRSVSLTSPSGQLVLGMSRTSIGAGIPAGLQSDTGATAELVALGANRFYRVLGLPTAHENVYALPGAQGTVVGICRTSSSAFAQGCERVLATVSVTRPPAGTPGAAVSYTRALSLILASLDHARAHLSAQLAQAGTALAQSQALRGLASAHGAVAREVAALPADGAADANRALAAALRQTAGAYASLAEAAQRKNPRAYRAGLRSVTNANAAMRAALAELTARGFRIV